jgi:hypothetical protein
MGSHDIFPRMFYAAVCTLALIVLAFMVQATWPGSLVAVSLYKAHLMALGGWGGYWIDRALFPYDRPHEYLVGDDEPAEAEEGYVAAPFIQGQFAFNLCMIRRAIVVAACLICVGLGA